jgi:hypothetical protein
MIQTGKCELGDDSKKAAYLVIYLDIIPAEFGDGGDFSFGCTWRLESLQRQQQCV